MTGCNSGKVLNIPGFPVFQVSANSSIAKGSEYAGIWLNNALWQGSKYAWSTFHRVLKLVSAIFYEIFIFSPNDSPLKTMKNVFNFI